jgi:zinc/manganese transport system ATP-binding protein
VASEIIVDADQLGMRFGGLALWRDISLHIEAGEFLAVLGPNGSGKSTLLKLMLGLLEPTSGSIKVMGNAPGRGNSRVGYIPQQHAFDRDLPVRGRDLVGMGIDGHHFGWPWRSPATRATIDNAIAEVRATPFANSPIGLLSGGEQQRLRIAQSLSSDPRLLLCDEPLLSLDLASQDSITAVINERRKQRDMAVVFVTHEINPVLPYVDRVLYLVPGNWAIGKPAEILTSENLSRLYGSQVEVVRAGDRLLVVGAGEELPTEPGGHHHHHGEHEH